MIGGLGRIRERDIKTVTERERERASGRKGMEHGPA